MSVLVSVNLKIKPGHADDVQSWIEEETRHTRAYDGCNGVTIHRDQDDPNHILFLGHWDSRQHHEQYLSWRVESGDVEELMGWLAEAATAQYFDNVEV